MAQYRSVTVKLSNSQLNKVKSALKNDIEIILSLSSNVIDDSKDEANFLHKLLLTKRNVSNLHKAIANSSASIELSKT